MEEVATTLGMVNTVSKPVGHRSLTEERGPAQADVLEDRCGPDDVQISVVLAREQGGRRIFRRRAGSDGVCCMLAELCMLNGRKNIADAA